MRKKNAFRGGILFDPFEGQPAGPVEQVVLPSKVLIPLQQGCDGPVQPRVELHEHVSRGQLIGLDPANENTPIHSSVCGTVEQVGRLEEAGPVIVSIAVDDAGDAVPGPPMGADFGRHSAPEVAGVLFAAGVTSMTRDGIPVPPNPRGVDPGRIDTLIVSAIETGVLAVSPEALVGGRVKDLAIGIQVRARALQVEQTWLDRKRGV